MSRVKSKHPGKQRKYLHLAPYHIRKKFLTAPLSDGLRSQHGIRNLPIRKNDTVLIVRGDYAGQEGKVVRVDYKKTRIYIENVKRKKVDGSEVYVPIHPSKVVITKLDLKDKMRKEIIERRTGG